MRKTLYIDMDNTLVDFSARLEGIDQGLRTRYLGREDELPGLFALMPPMPGALEAFAGDVLPVLLAERDQGN